MNPSSIFGSLESLNTTKYELLNKDTVLLEFCRSNSLASKFNIIKKFSTKVYNPFYLMDNLQFDYWMDNRAIPSNREHLDKLLLSLNLSDDDRFNLLIVNHACSLNDTFWIREKYELNLYNMPLTFEDVNLYKGFKDHVGLITFFGNTSSLGGRIKTPELTTQGMLRKAWRVIKENGKESIYLYKAGTYGFSNSGNENYSEVLACKVAEILGLNHVTYELVNWDSIECCRCELFTSEKVGYYPMKEFIADKFGTKVIWNYSMVSSILGESLIAQLDDLMVFDFIIENQDRHFSNFGLLLDNDTGDVLGLAPIFDNGYSLLNFETSSTFKDYDYYKSSTGTFNIPNVNQATEVIKKNPSRYKHWAKMLMLHLDELNIKGIPNDRVEAVKKLITVRCKYIQSL